MARRCMSVAQPEHSTNVLINPPPPTKRTHSNVDSSDDTNFNTTCEDKLTSDGRTNGKFAHVQCMIETLPNDLTADQRHRITDLIENNADIFSQHQYDLGRTHMLEATIETGSHPAISEPLRRHAKAHLDLIDKTVNDLQAAGLIEEGTGSWSSNLVLVSKPGRQTPRVTVDLRRLNAITSRQSFPMPPVSESLEFLSQSRYLTCLDFTASYFQVPLRKQDREKTGFLTRQNLFQWTVLPQGATNSPAIFSRLMSLVLRGLNYLCCLSFIDDVVIVGRNFDEHLLNLQLVLNRFRYANLKLKPSKCRLCQHEISYLGFKVTGDSIRPDETKTACIRE